MLMPENTAENCDVLFVNQLTLNSTEMPDIVSNTAR